MSSGTTTAAKHGHREAKTMPNLPTEQHKSVISCACLIFKKGSILHTDFWKGYLGIDKKGYTHERVNLSDPENPFVGMKSKFVV